MAKTAAQSLPLDQVTLEQSFSKGIVSDTAREQIPAGGVYDLRDFLADVPGKIYKRGGTEFQGDEIGDGNVILVAVACPEFPGDPRVLVIASDGFSTRSLYDVSAPTPSVGADIGTTQPIENPTFIQNKLILCDGTGAGDGITYEPVKAVANVAGTLTVDQLGGDPPNCRYSCAHLGYLVLANGIDPDTSVNHVNRLWFNPTGVDEDGNLLWDIESPWNTAVAWIDVPEAITGLASVNGTLLVFTRGFTWRILREFPPGSTNADGTVLSNMQLQPLGAIGCIDARSIVTGTGGLVYFANESGVYYTNAAGFKAITSKDDGSGIQKMWVDAVAGFAPVLGSVVCGGVWLNDNLFYTVRHSDDDVQEGARYQFLYHGQTGAWTTLADACTADMYATRFAPEGNIYAACGDPDDPVQLLKLSGLFSPDETNSLDANGEEVIPIMEGRPFYERPGIKSFGFGHLTYQLSLADDPTSVLQIQTERGMVSSGTATRRLVGESEEPTRVRFDVNFDSQAATVKVVQSSPSATTEIHGIEVEVRPYDLDSEIQ